MIKLNVVVDNSELSPSVLPNSCFLHIHFLSITSYWLLKHESVILQSGKSAAVYACAREQGFEVLEVSLFINLFWLFMLSTDLPL